jgi:hypothetical protein
MKAALAAVCVALLAVALAFIAVLISMRSNSPPDVIAGLLALALAAALLRVALEIIRRKP